MFAPKSHRKLSKIVVPITYGIVVRATIWLVGKIYSYGKILGV